MPEGSQDAEVSRLVLEGDRLGKAGDWAAALARYDQAIARAPRSARAHYHRAIALSKLGRKSELAAALEQVLFIDPEHEKARAGLSQLQGRSRPAAAGEAPARAPTPTRAQGATRPVGDDGVPIDWQAGDVILDLYEVKGVAGEGGMGKVYRALHRGWNLELAVKSPRPEVFAKAGGADKFVQEAETWVNLGLHPHIASCFYVRTLGGVPRIFAEYVEGGSLEDWIVKRNLYEGGPDEALRRILDIAIQFAWGLRYAHEKGLIHQDVKPANVLMTPEGDVKVTDFGLAGARAAVEAGRHDEATRWLGQTGKPDAKALRSILVSCGGMTPAYCSPEQARKEKLTFRTDLWSWAVSVLEMFTGGVGWMSGLAAPHVLATLREEGSEDAALPRMPEAVAELLERSFQADPATRPRDMAAAAKALRGIYAEVAGEPYPREEPEAAKLMADALNNRAVSLIDLGRESEAGQILEEALRADAKHLQATYNLGLVRWRGGTQTDDALVYDLLDQVSTDAATWESHLLLGWVQNERRNGEEAKAAFDRASERAGSDALAQRIVALATASVRPGVHCLRVIDRHSSWELEGDEFDRVSRQMSVLWSGQLTGAYGVTLTDDGRVLLTASWKEVRVWDVETGRLIRSLAGHGGTVLAIAATPDGRHAVSASDDRTICAWEVATGRKVMTLTGHEGWVTSLALTPDGRFLLSGSKDCALRLWELSWRGGAARCVREKKVHKGQVNAIALNADAKIWLTAGAEGAVIVWDFLAPLVRALTGHSSWVPAVALSRDGRCAVTLDSTDGIVRMWDTVTGRLIRQLAGHTSHAWAVALTADARHALTSGVDGTMRLWDLEAGQCLRTIEAQVSGGMTSSEPVLGVAITPNALRAAGASLDGKLRVWQLPGTDVMTRAPYSLVRPLATKDVLQLKRRNTSALTAAQERADRQDWAGALVNLCRARAVPGYERDAKTLALADTLALRVGRADLRGTWTSSILRGQVRPSCLALRHDGQVAVCSGQEAGLWVWSLETLAAVRKFELALPLFPRVVLTPDGRWVVSGDREGALRVLEVASGRELRTMKGHAPGLLSVRGLDISQDGRLLVSAGEDGKVRVWDLTSGACLRSLEGHSKGALRAKISGDGLTVVSSGEEDGTLRVWDVAAGQCVRVLPAGAKLFGVALCADGRRALTGGDDKMLRVWNLESGKCQRVIQGHVSFLCAVDLSIDGRMAASASDDRTVRLWDVESGRCLGVLRGHRDTVRDVRLSKDGRFALSVSDDGTLRQWRLDWQIEPHHAADWDEAAGELVEVFLSCHTPVLEDGVSRCGRATWTDADFDDLYRQLQWAGLGWLRKEGVRAKLAEMARTWKGPPPLA